MKANDPFGCRDCGTLEAPTSGGCMSTDGGGDCGCEQCGKRECTGMGSQSLDQKDYIGTTLKRWSPRGSRSASPGFRQEYILPPAGGGRKMGRRVLNHRLARAGSDGSESDRQKMSAKEKPESRKPAPRPVNLQDCGGLWASDWNTSHDGVHGHAMFGSGDIQTRWDGGEVSMGATPWRASQ